MSVLIRGIQMPKNCAECPVALSGKYCRINQTYTTYIKLPIRPVNCPLAELPEKHGRLIDADEALKKHCTEFCRKKPSCEEDCIIYDLLHFAKSVIEAEGEG